MWYLYIGCVDGDIRLIGGSTVLEGRVELCKNNAWGTLCDDGWDHFSARIVCRQLGFSVSGMVVLHSLIAEQYTDLHSKNVVITSLLISLLQNSFRFPLLLVFVYLASKCHIRYSYHHTDYHMPMDGLHRLSDLRAISWCI